LLFWDIFPKLLFHSIVEQQKMSFGAVLSACLSTLGQFSWPPRTIRTLSNLTLAVGLSIVLGACGSDDSSSGDSGNANAGNTNNDAVVQRFGTRTVRELNPPSDSAIESQVIQSFNDLTLQLLREQADAEPGANTVNSGYSLAIALAMLQRGTANGDLNVIQQLLGVTAIEEAALYSAINAIDLDLESRGNDGLELRSANQLFVQPGFALENDFLDVMTSEFDAPISEAQFMQAPEAVRQAINDWAADNTNDLIPELLAQPLPTNTVLALLNATLLDAKWRQTFTDVDQHVFTNASGQQQTVAGFAETDNFQFLETDDALSVAIEYEGSQVSLMIIVPNDIETYSANLTAADISQRHNNSQSALLALTVPNWEIESSIDFTQLPMTSSLVGRMLNMTRMTPEATCCEITSFKQQAVIEVDKDGTRAAAVTSIGVGVTSVQIPEPRVVSIDKPFLYFIRDEPTGTILFSGRVLGL
jgi:serpin B